MFTRNKVAAYVGELLGTGALTLVFLSIYHSNLALQYFVALAVGLAVVGLSFVFGGTGTTTGAVLNPAVTLGLWTIRKIKSVDAIIYIALQLVGAYLAYLLYTYFAKQTFPAISTGFMGRVLVAEALGTFILAFGWTAAYYRGLRGLSQSAVAGLSYFGGIIAASAAAYGFLNPAVALGMRSFEWGTYVLGPVLGALIGTNLYSLLFARPEATVTVAAETAVVGTQPVAASTETPAVTKPATTRKPRTTTVTAPAKKPVSRAKRPAKK